MVNNTDGTKVLLKDYSDKNKNFLDKIVVIIINKEVEAPFALFCFIRLKILSKYIIIRILKLTYYCNSKLKLLKT